MVWGAPTSRSSGGRSAVQAMSGTPPRSASTTAACSSAAAVPLVVTTSAGCPPARPIPSAVKAAERSSSRTCIAIAGWAARARARGSTASPGRSRRGPRRTGPTRRPGWRRTRPGRPHPRCRRRPSVRSSRVPHDHGHPTLDPDLPGSGRRGTLHAETVGERPAPGDGPRVHPDRPGVGRDGRQPGHRPPGGPGRPARPRRIVRGGRRSGGRGAVGGGGRWAGDLPRILDGGPLLSPRGSGPPGPGRQAGPHLGDRRDRGRGRAPAAPGLRRRVGRGARPVGGSVGPVGGSVGPVGARSAGSHRRSGRSSAGGWTAPCSRASIRRPTVWTSGSAIPAPDWRRACAWPGPGHNDRCGRQSGA